MSDEELIRVARVFATCKIFGMQVKLNELNISPSEQDKIDRYLCRVSKEVSNLETPQEKITALFTF